MKLERELSIIFVHGSARGSVRGEMLKDERKREWELPNTTTTITMSQRSRG